MTFSVGAGIMGGVLNEGDPSRPKPGDGYHLNTGRVQRMQCFPLFSVLLAMGNPQVDYLSLDVEGTELGILKTIPFDKVLFWVFLPCC